MRFINFALDGVTLETNDVVTSNHKLLDGTNSFAAAAAADNKKCAKNSRYQLIGDSCAATIVNHNIDCNILLQAGFSKDLTVVKILQVIRRYKVCFHAKL